MSAKLLRVKQLQNELTDTQFQLNELSTENRILRTLQKRQDMALRKYEGTQAELPQLIRSHNEEVRGLKMKLKQVKTQNRELENHLKMRECELSALQEQHKHLLKLSKDKHLGEREQLQQQLDQMQDLIKEQDKKVQMLSRKVILEGKNYKHQLTAEVTRHKKTTKELDIALDRIAQLETVLEAKEKYIATNLTRTLGHQPPSLISSVPQSRLLLYQSPSETATTRNLSLKPTTFTDFKKHKIEENNKKEETFTVTHAHKKRPDSEQHEVLQKHSLCSQEVYMSLNDGEDGNDTDGDYQLQLVSESIESQSYTSQNTSNRSTENICRDPKDASEPYSPLPEGGFVLSAAQSHSTEEAHQTGIISLKKNASRRFSVSVDGGLISSGHSTKSSRRGSLNGTDGSKEELVIVSNLMSEAGKNTLIEKDFSGKYNSYSLETAEPCKHVVTESTSAVTINTNPAEIVTSNDFPEKSFSNNNECKYMERNKSQIPPSDMAAEESLFHLPSVSTTRNETQNRVRDETRTQCETVKCVEEQKSVDEKIDNQIIPDNYNKNHLLAALRAIEDGSDPVNLNDNINDYGSQMPIIKSKNMKYGNVSLAVDNLHRSIPVHTSSSVSGIGMPQKEHNSFWDNDTSLSPRFLNKEIGRSRAKSDIMQNLFQNEK